MNQSTGRAAGLADRNRDAFRRNGVIAMNLLGSPGSGKTTLLERTVDELKHHASVAVVAAGVHTDIDAKRISQYDVPVVPLVLQGKCHIDAGMLRSALDGIALGDTELLFIENVSGLICPSLHDLGESLTVAVLGVTEGDDKPLKHPELFRRASILVINKMDLLQWVTFDLDAFKRQALELNPGLKIFQISCTLGYGLREWYEWLLHEVRLGQEWVAAREATASPAE